MGAGEKVTSLEGCEFDPECALYVVVVTFVKIRITLYSKRESASLSRGTLKGTEVGCSLLHSRYYELSSRTDPYVLERS